MQKMLGFMMNVFDSKSVTKKKNKKTKRTKKKHRTKATQNHLLFNATNETPQMP